jgi:hypothetical protein
MACTSTPIAGMSPPTACVEMITRFEEQTTPSGRKVTLLRA